MLKPTGNRMRDICVSCGAGISSEFQISLPPLNFTCMSAVQLSQTHV